MFDIQSLNFNMVSELWRSTSLGVEKFQEKATLLRRRSTSFGEEDQDPLKVKIMMNNIDSQHLRCPQFDGGNYDFWCVKMKTIFLSFDLWDYVEDGFVEVEDTTNLSIAEKQQLKDHRKKDAKALSLIQQGVADSIFPRIINATKAKVAWDILQKEYRGTEKVRAIKLQSLKRDFENLKMQDVEVLQDYFSRVMELVNQMKIHGDDIADKRVVEKILISLPQRYDSIVFIIEQTQDMEKLSVEELMGSIKAFEVKLNSRSEKSTESAFQSQLNIGPTNAMKQSSNFDRAKSES